MQQAPEILTDGYDAVGVAHQIVNVAVDKKAGDVTLIEVGKVTTLSEYFIIATADSDRQVRAVSRGVQNAMKEEGVRLLGEDGPASDGWVLLDYGQVMVHIFSPEQRDYYDLERRWQDAPTLLKIQ